MKFLNQLSLFLPVFFLILSTPVHAGPEDLARFELTLAGYSIGMTYAEMMWHIILPQAVRRMVPPFVNQSVIQFKNTALLYVVAVPDMMYTGYLVVADTYRPLEVYTSVAIAYFAILYPLTQWGKRLEARSDR